MQPTRWVVAPGPAGVSQARRVAETTFAEAGLSPRERQTLLILVSELVTNAVIHGAPPVVLEIDIDAIRSRVCVADGSSGFLRIRSADASSFGGRGLALVEQLATDWGVLFGEGGKRVWFELDRVTTTRPVAPRGAPVPGPTDGLPTRLHHRRAIA